MIYKDEYHPQVKKDLKKLSPKLRQIVREEHISAILLNPDKGKFRKIAGFQNAYNSE